MPCFSYSVSVPFITIVYRMRRTKDITYLYYRIAMIFIKQTSLKSSKITKCNLL